MRCSASARLLLLAVAAAAVARPVVAQEKVDNATIERIKSEAMDRSQVMDLMSWLTDVHGPRLTGSPITKEAGDWAITTMKKWGVANVHYETFPFGRGWVSQAFTAQMVAPHAMPLIAYPGAWTDGTKGTVTGDVVRVRLDSMADLAANRGKLRGKWILQGTPVPQVAAHFTPEGARFNDSVLAVMAGAQPPAPGGGRGNNPAGGRGGVPADTAAQRRQREFTAARAKFLVDEGILGTLIAGRGDGGTVFPGGNGPRAVNAPAAPPTISLATEHFGRISRLLDRNVPVKVEINSKVAFFTADSNSFNIIGEIPGTDPALKDEVVMIGAHFDSWHSGTGATDNAAGSAIMMEAMRILKTLNLQPRRTIKIGLWTGEEQGLLGSRAYARQHYGFADSTGFHPTAEQAKFAAYFNVDNGTGKIRGVYQQGNAAVGPIFDAWMGPFKAGGMKTLTISNTGGTDHQSFDGVGLPGFQFIQDPVEYGTRTHHSSQDLYERIQPEDMKWNSAVLAAFAWQAAQRDEKLPRKAPPGASQGGRGGRGGR